MTILKSGNTIRLSGKDAADYLRDTGRALLPRTIEEFNHAQAQSAGAWRAIGCPEAELLAVLNEMSKIPVLT